MPVQFKKITKIIKHKYIISYNFHINIWHVFKKPAKDIEFLLKIIIIISKI